MNVGWLGYAPDIDPTTPGVIVDCEALVPTLRGMRSAPSAVDSSLGALAAACRGGATLKKLDNTTRTFAGSATKMYEDSSGTWTDRTRAVGGDYNLGTDTRWVFAQFGNVSIAANKEDIIQSSSSGAFANIAAGAPKAKIVEVVGSFVFAFNCNDQGTLIDSADTTDRWWCSALGDETDWTPATSTQCASGRLLSSPGPITAAKRFGSNVVAFKGDSMFLGTYVGPPAIWDFQEIPGRVGAPCQEAVASVGTPDNPRLIWMGAHDFYMYDGSRPIPIGTNRVKNKVFGAIQRSKIDKCITVHDSVNSLVYFWHPKTDTANPDACVVYNYRSDRWGRHDLQIQYAFDYVVPAVTYSGVGNLFSTYGDISDLTYGSPYWMQSYPAPAVFDTAQTLQTLSGATSPASLTTGDFGDDVSFSTLRRARIRYIVKPSSSVATMTNFYRANSGDALTQDQTANEVSGKFDVMRSARWHRMVFNFSGNVETPGMVVDLEKDGDE